MSQNPHEFFTVFKTIAGMKLIFCVQLTYLLTLQIDDVSLDGHGQVCPGMPKEATKTLISQKLMEV